ncbi:hypothetical protein CKM354_000645000 [Cercospora kikuchii]|uniref:RRM domain-containing protein n=1 Tax=Cercospora kikuchii TaxID=84275 RepID=A0A9P3FDC0_9PEZI|nr:uncharacterized protein CKM354_000645000 [Cercospora kikuchii]GIZ43216.1 hypothetical protein CKM354_000645000 [Cercospora kikuchii]
MAYDSPRLYVGNLPYSAQREDIEKLFADNNFEITKVDISIDSFSGRNPSYCFVEFRSQEDAERAMSSLQGIDLLGRPIRINPKTERRSNPNGERTPNRAFEQRGWRPREGQTSNVNGSSYSTDRWNRNDNNPQLQSQGEDPKRVYVGGLPQLPDQQSVEAEIRSLFAEYEVQAISKLISPHSINGNDTGSSNYCFVDLATPEQAADAVKCLNGRPTPHDGTYRVSPAKGKRSTGPVDREPQPPPPASTRVFISGLPAIESQAELDNQIRELFAGLDIKEVSKLIVPHESKQIESGNHHYCFATFERQEEAERAVEAMNGSPTPNGGTYVIKFARERPAGGFSQGERFGGGYQPRFQQREGQDSPRRFQQQREQGPQPTRDFGGNWRRKD